MASRCINPQCENQLSYFGAGALYSLQEMDKSHTRRHMQYLWLCASCAPHYALQTDSGGKLIVTPRSLTLPFKARDASTRLRLVFRSRRVPLPLGRCQSDRTSQSAMERETIEPQIAQSS